MYSHLDVTQVKIIIYIYLPNKKNPLILKYKINYKNFFSLSNLLFQFVYKKENFWCRPMV